METDLFNVVARSYDLGERIPMGQHKTERNRCYYLAIWLAIVGPNAPIQQAKQRASQMLQAQRKMLEERVSRILKLIGLTTNQSITSLEDLNNKIIPEPLADELRMWHNIGTENHSMIIEMAHWAWPDNMVKVGIIVVDLDNEEGPLIKKIMSGKEKTYIILKKRANHIVPVSIGESEVTQFTKSQIEAMSWYNEWEKQEPTQIPSRMSLTELRASRQVLLSMEPCRDSSPEMCTEKILMKTAYTIGVGGTNTLKVPQQEELTASENEETPELDEYD